MLFIYRARILNAERTMRKEIADHVFPIFTKGLLLRSRLERGERVDVAKERNNLIRQLKGLPGRPEFVGDGHFRGIRYALACWLDDLFILDLSSAAESAHATEWLANAVELEFHPEKQRLRATDFWEQHGLARQFDADVLGVYYLCVLLGFRGDKRDQPAQLAEWRKLTEDVLKRDRPKGWPGRPPERPITSDVTPLVARDRLLRAMLLLGGLLGLAVPGLTFSLVYLLNHR